MLFKKPEGLKYTQLCMYIDQHIPTIAEAGKDAQVQNTVYNYLWLVVKALAIKKRMFQNFEDYDGYAFHSASRLFFALRNNYNNQGKVIKGKQIRPIKSCLNYMKALLYPMKVQYQNQHYSVVVDPASMNGAFDPESFRDRLKESAQTDQSFAELNKQCLLQSLASFDRSVEKVLDRSPFRTGSVQRYRVKASILLNFAKSLKASNALVKDITSVTLWRLPKSMAGYVKLLYTQAIVDFKTDLVQCFAINAVDDAILQSMISNPTGGFINHEE